MASRLGLTSKPELSGILAITKSLSRKTVHTQSAFHLCMLFFEVTHSCSWDNKLGPFASDRRPLGMRRLLSWAQAPPSARSLSVRSPPSHHQVCVLPHVSHVWELLG